MNSAFEKAINERITLAAISEMVIGICEKLNIKLIQLTMMIFFVSYDRASPVHLFGQYQSYQLMRKNKLGESPRKVGSFFNFIIHAKSATNQKYQTLDTFIGSLLNKFC